MSSLLEAVGFLLVVAFCWFVWPPLCLLVGGAGLILAANLLGGTPKDEG